MRQVVRVRIHSDHILILEPIPTTRRIRNLNTSAHFLTAAAGYPLLLFALSLVLVAVIIAAVAVAAATAVVLLAGFWPGNAAGHNIGHSPRGGHHTGTRLVVLRAYGLCGRGGGCDGLTLLSVENLTFRLCGV